MLVQQRRGDHQHLGPAVVQQVLVVGRLQERIERDGDRADLDRAEEREHALGRVGQDDGHALFHANTQVDQGVAQPVDPFLKVAVGNRLLAAEDGGLAAASRRHVRVDQGRCRVESIGKSSAESGMVMFFSCKAKFRSIVPSKIPGVNRRARRALAVLSVCDATSCIARPALLRPIRSRPRKAVWKALRPQGATRTASRQSRSSATAW